MHFPSDAGCTFITNGPVSSVGVSPLCTGASDALAFPIFFFISWPGKIHFLIIIIIWYIFSFCCLPEWNPFRISYLLRSSSDVHVCSSSMHFALCMGSHGLWFKKRKLSWNHKKKKINLRTVKLHYIVKPCLKPQWGFESIFLVKASSFERRPTLASVPNNFEGGHGAEKAVVFHSSVEKC